MCEYFIWFANTQHERDAEAKVEKKGRERFQMPCHMWQLAAAAAAATATHTSMLI